MGERRDGPASMNFGDRACSRAARGGAGPGRTAIRGTDGVRPVIPCRFDLSPADAAREQERLRPLVRIERLATRGLLLDLPTIGCAKSRLTGLHDEPGPRRGDRTPLRDGREVIGTVLRTRDRVKPLHVSPGHRAILRDAEAVVLLCGAGYRLPEPTRRADASVGRLARSLA